MDIGMTEHARPILTMDGYQLVALTQDHTYDPDRIIAYVVTKMSGARLHHARTLEEARSWRERQDEVQVGQSEESRGGKEGVSPCSSRRSPVNKKNRQKKNTKHK